jgi:hypothetical protein
MHIKDGDMVLLRSPHTEASGKPEPKWNGPFMVIEKTRPGSFHLADNEGRMLDHSKSATNLHCFYV